MTADKLSRVGSGISDIEASVLQHLLAGKTHAGIAEALGLTKDDVGLHVRSLLSRLNAHSRTSLIAAAMRALRARTSVYSLYLAGGRPGDWRWSAKSGFRVAARLWREAEEC